MQAKEIMTQNVISITSNSSIENAVSLLLENNISGIPVVDNENKIIGIITERDIIFQEKNLHAPLFLNIFDGIIQLGHSKFKEEFKKISAYTIEDLMTKKVYTVNEDTDHKDISDLMVQRNINRVPVVNDQGNLSGIITRSDIIKAVYSKDK